MEYFASGSTVRGKHSVIIIFKTTPCQNLSCPSGSSPMGKSDMKNRVDGSWFRDVCECNRNSNTTVSRFARVYSPSHRVLYYPEKRPRPTSFTTLIKPCVTYYDPPRITAALDPQGNSREFENNLTAHSRCFHGTTNLSRRRNRRFFRTNKPQSFKIR